MRNFWAAVVVGVFVACSPSGGGGSGGGGGGLLGGGGGSSAGGSGGGGGGSTGGGAADAGQGTQNCVWLGNCVDPCAANDTACLDACAAQATASALTKWNAYAGCSNAHNCQDAACINANCSAELAACQGDSGSAGYTTSGSCLVVVNIPGAAMQSWCWDYQLTASGNHNDGSEHWWYYDSTSVTNGQTECTAANNRTSSMMVSGPLDPATVSAGNLSNKRSACTSSSMYITMTWSENGTCGAAGSLGHCTWAVTNTYDSASSTVSGLTTTTWAVP